MVDNAVLVTPRSRSYHTVLHCEALRERMVDVDTITVTTSDKARRSGKRKCTRSDCAGTPWYWWREGISLTSPDEREEMSGAY